MERPSSTLVEEAASTAGLLVPVMEASDNLSEHDRGFWARVLENLSVDIPYRLGPNPFPALELVELRDRQMAQNVLWLMNELYPDKKLVVWAATLHTSRNLHLIDVTEDYDTPWGLTLQEMYREKRVMGDYLRDELGEEMYSLGFTTFEGYFYRGRGEPGRIEPASAGSLEELLARADIGNAIVDLRSSSPGSEWLGEALTARLIGHSKMVAEWPRLLDGVFFIPEMTPSTPTGD